MSDYACQSVGEKRTTPRVISKAISYDNLSQRFKTFAINALSAKESRNYNESIKEECWKKAMETEINVLQANNTWIVADLSPNKEPIGCKSVYKNKLKAYGTIERHKSRLVAKGYGILKPLVWITWTHSAMWPRSLLLGCC